MLLLNTLKVLELSGLFVCQRGLAKIVPRVTEEIAGLGFAREGSVPRLTLCIFHNVG